MPEPVEPTGPAELIGRSTELELLHSFLGSRDAPSGLVLHGDAGVGKSALLDAADAHARARGWRVLRATGAEFEVDVSFAGLSQALLPLRDQIGRLSPTHRA